MAKLLELDDEIQVVGEASDGAEAIALVRRLAPDVVLMDVQMPTMDGLAATETISAKHPSSQVILMSVHADAEGLRRAMLAGAREFLVKPFTAEELTQTLRQVHSLRPLVDSSNGAAADNAPLYDGKIVTVYSPKGGVGCTTVATNIAVALARRHQKRVLLIDLDLSFGDVALLLNLTAERGLADAVGLWRDRDVSTLEELIQNSVHGIRVLMAPPRPEAAEPITVDMVRWLLEEVHSRYDYIVCDTRCTLDDITLAALDLADQIVLLMTLEVPAIKDTKLFLEVCQLLGYPEQKISLVVNRADSSGGIRLSDVENGLAFKASATIVSEGRLTTFALNQGVPFVVSNPDSSVTRAIFNVTDLITGNAPDPTTMQAPKRTSRLFGLLRSG
ncbi:MAG: response regulator [Chloroflexi bacterium]|nr:response regulator [Chloroflexota bacterium]